MGKLKIPPQKIDITREEKRRVIGALFPQGRLLGPITQGAMEETEGITEAEVEKAGIRLKERKAPGEDGIAPETVKCFVECRKHFCARMLGCLYNRGVFPNDWKRAKVVLIPKPGREGGEPSAYRPICLINTLGKLYEAVILGKLESELERTGGLSNKQYGFRKGKSTIEAVQEVLKIANDANRQGKWALLILLDVRNAFNMASWVRIIENLEQRGIEPKLLQVIANYLKDRSLIIRKGECRAQSRGVPQGSILGPTLWNVIYDNLLQRRWQEGVYLIAYADDLAVIVTHKKEKTLSEVAGGTLAEISTWMEENELELAPEKTEAMVLAGMRRPKNIELVFGGGRVELKREVKYLGITIDKSTTFSSHVAKACAKAEKSVAALTRILPNIGGPGEEKRRIVASMTNSIILYGAQVWAGAMRIQRNRNRILSVQRKMALRVCSGYRTMSTEAALVIAGLIPLDLLIRERQEISRLEGDMESRRKEARERTMNAWQREWENANKGEWTRSLIKDVRRWKERKYGTVNYYLTQFLAGHGSFAQYLKRFKIKEEDTCEACGQVDTPGHLLTTCTAWRGEREEMCRIIGEEIELRNLVDIALRGRREWENTLGRITTLMKAKEDRMKERPE